MLIRGCKYGVHQLATNWLPTNLTRTHPHLKYRSALLNIFLFCLETLVQLKMKLGEFVFVLLIAVAVSDGTRLALERFPREEKGI